MIKYSKQREAILRNLQGRRDHPTADMVYESVRKNHPNISLGTVYRNLSMLADQGLILKISTGIGPDHFDGFTGAHHHFICKGCGTVLDLDYIPGIDLAKEASGAFDGSIDGCDLQFWGKCKACCIAASLSV